MAGSVGAALGGYALVVREEETLRPDSPPNDGVVCVAAGGGELLPGVSKQEKKRSLKVQHMRDIWRENKER